MGAWCFHTKPGPRGTQSLLYITCSVCCVNTASGAISASGAASLAAGCWLLAGCRPLAVASGLLPEKLSPIQLDHNRGCYPGESAAAVLAIFWHLPVGRNFDPKAIRSVGASAQPGSDLGLEGGDKRLGTHREWLIVAGFALDQAAFGDGAPADSLYWLWGERQLPMHTAVTSSQ